MKKFFLVICFAFLSVAGNAQTFTVNNLQANGSVSALGAFSIAGNQFWPSLWNTRAYYNMIVPNAGTWFDNVITVQNKSIAPDTQVSGNAAFRFVDNVNGYERAAFGYSRVNTGTAGGYYPDILYAEVGNLTAGDPDDTDFGVIVTHSAGTVHFPGTSLVAMRVVSSTGDTNFMTQGSGAINFGVVGTPVEATWGMQNSKIRIRERDSVNNASITTNMSLAGAQDNATLPSWEIALGGTDDAFSVGRVAAGGTSPNKFPNLMNLTSTGDLVIPGAMKANSLVAPTGGTIAIGSPTQQGPLGTPIEASFGMTSVYARLRERDNANNISLTTNVSLAGAQDNAALPSWELSMGGTDDEFHVGRLVPGGTSPNKLPNLLSINGVNGLVTSAGPIKTGGYTVGTIPAGTIGARAYVTDATSCTFMSPLTGGGSTVCPAFFNGTTWVAE